MVSASQKLIHMQGVGACGRVLAQHRKVGGRLAIEQRNLLEFRAGELGQAARIRLAQQRGQPVPVGPAFEKPLVGEDLRHGPEFRSA